MARVGARRRLPRRVVVAAALFAGVLAGWTVLSPVARPPDETAHVDVVLLVASGGTYPEFDQRHPSVAVVQAALAHAPGLGGRWLTSGNAPSDDDRQTFAQMGGDRPTDSINQIPQHPPLYYELMGAALRVERMVSPGGDQPLDREWNVLRLLNVALLVPLPLLVWSAARRLGAGDRAAETAAFLPLAVPQLTHIGGSVNNDNLLVLLSAVVALGVAGVIGGDGRRSTAGLIGVAAALAVLTKAFGFLLLPWIVAAYAYRVLAAGSGRRRTAGNVALAIGPAAAAGGAWLVRNLVRHDELLPSSLAEEFSRPRPGFSPDLLDYLTSYGSGLVRSAWGSFGSHEARLGVPVVVAATIALVVATVMGVRGGDARVADGSGGRGGATGGARPRLLYLSVAGLVALVLAVQDFDSYRFSGMHPFMQGRYLFVALVPVLVVAAMGVARIAGRRGPLLALAVATVMQVLSVRAGLAAWWGEPGSSVRESVDALVAWSTWPSWLLAVGASTLAVVWVGAFVLTADVRSAGSGEPQGGEGVLHLGGPVGEGVASADQ